MRGKVRGCTDLCLEAVGHLGDGLLQEQGHQQEVDLGDVGVFGQQGLQDGGAGEVARVPVDLPQRGTPAGTPAHVETWRRQRGSQRVNTPLGLKK